VFVADSGNCRIREVTGGTITTVAGTGMCTYSGDGGPATGAALQGPLGLVLDASGNLYIADTGNCRIREVSGGTITTVAGIGTCGFSGDGGPATSAALNQPWGVALDASGNIYIADYLNCRVRMVHNHTITTVAGSGTCGSSGDGGPATSATLSHTSGVASDGAGDLYISDTYNCRIRSVVGGTITTFAGTGFCSFSGDGGPATSAALYLPGGVGLDGSGNVYIADNHCLIRKVSAGIIVTVAGIRACGFSGDGGPATSAAFNNTSSVAIDGNSNLYIADSQNNRIREVVGPGPDPDGDGDTDFFNPGQGLPCIQDHKGDANGDGYSDADELTPYGAASCTGAFPGPGGLGLTGLSSSSITSACPGRAPGSAGAKKARADVDLDGFVSILDLAVVASAPDYLSRTAFTPVTDRRFEKDQNGDGLVNILDLALLAAPAVYLASVPPC
jgi:NHL repeat